jgi:hypothetical protein
VIIFGCIVAFLRFLKEKKESGERSFSSKKKGCAARHLGGHIESYSNACVR